MELISIEDAHLTYPPRFRRHQSDDDPEGAFADPEGLDVFDAEDDTDDDAEGRKSSEQPIVALRGVSLSVEPGEGLALVGKPGSGRSTLLSLMSGVLRPDAGVVKVRGRATGLPAAGAGFVGHMSVRENITRNLLLMGEPIRRARALAPRVAEWLGISTALDARNSSLGRPMVRQLGFATALHAQPNVFLADDDITTIPKPVRDRGIQKMLSFREDGRALVVAGNRLEMLNTLCTRALLLDEGKVIAEGSVTEVVELFRRSKRGDLEEGDTDEHVDS